MHAYSFLARLLLLLEIVILRFEIYLEHDALLCFQFVLCNYLNFGSVEITVFHLHGNVWKICCMWYHIFCFDLYYRNHLWLMYAHASLLAVNFMLELESLAHICQFVLYEHALPCLSCCNFSQLPCVLNCS